MRPISVQTAWRLFESALVQSKSFRNWRENIGVGHLVAHREAAEQIAAQAAAKWRSTDARFLRAMDFSKAFDHKRHSQSAEALESGWPTRLIKLIVKVWLRQERFVTNDGRTDKNNLQSAVGHPWDQWFASCGSWEAPNGYGSISKGTDTKL